TTCRSERMSAARNLPHGRPNEPNELSDSRSLEDFGSLASGLSALFRPPEDNQLADRENWEKILGQNFYRAPRKGGCIQMNKGTAVIRICTRFFAKLDLLIATR